MHDKIPHLTLVVAVLALLVGCSKDANPSTTPTSCVPTTEVCDGVDNDCNGLVDEAGDFTTFYVDADHDGFGDPKKSTAACAAPTGFVANHDDCDDTRASVHPGAAEVCDGLDDDCNGAIDDDPAHFATFFADADHDGFGDPHTTSRACSAPAGFVTDGTDCDDTRALVHPKAADPCDGLDNDCNGAIDDDSSHFQTFYADTDGDGFGDLGVTARACVAPAGFVANASDCDDTRAFVHPGASEVCDGLDDDCNPQTVETGTATLFSADASVDFTAALTGTQAAPALAVVSAPGRLNLCQGTWFARLDVRADLDVTGVGGSALNVLDGADAGTVVTYLTSGVTASLTGLTIQNGNGTDAGSQCNGGGICVQGITLTGDDVVLTHNQSSTNGGGMAVNGGVVKLTHAQLVANRALSSGGGLQVRPNGAVTLTNSTVTGNSAGSQGGALFELGGGSAVIFDTVEVTDNTATSGAGLMLDNGTFKLVHGRLAGNVATTAGGAVKVNTNIPTFTDSVIEDNSAATGAAISIVGNRKVTLTCSGSARCGVFKNTASASTNAAVEVPTGTFAYTSCDFVEPGTGTGNTPTDVRAGTTSFTLGAKASGSCDSTGCVSGL